MPGAEVQPLSLVLDASVAVRWVVVEEGSADAVALLQRPARWIAPRLMLTEVASALSRKVGHNELRSEIAAQALDALIGAVSRGFVHLAADEELMPSALMLALSLPHKLPDCVYLALAERAGAGLATADRRLSALAEGRGIPTVLIPSA